MVTHSVAEKVPGAGAPCPRQGAIGRAVRWLDGHSAQVWLISTVALLTAGTGCWMAGARWTADLFWVLTAAAGLVPLVVMVMIGLLERRFGVDVIALLALSGALAIGEYFAAAVLAVMLASGQALEQLAQRRATHELTALLSRAPTTAHLCVGEEIRTVDVDDVSAGDTVMVKPGEVVPVDGRVTGTIAVLDESALTGESRLVDHRDGDGVCSGAVNGGGPFTLRVVHAAQASTYAAIVRMVAEAREARAPFVRLADRIAAIFLPVALVTALAAWLASGDVVRAVAVLVVATPCPLILAAPVAMASGISRAARRGVIIKGGAALEALAGGTIVLLDKTGTLTSGRPVLRDFEVAPGSDANEVLLLAASLDQMSPHVLAGAIVLGAKARSLNLVTPSEAQEEPGRGIRGVVNNHDVAVGRGSWVVPGADVPLWARRVRRRTAFEGLANVFVATDGQLTGAFVLEDPLRPDAARTVRTLRRAGIQRIIMVTGDHVDVAQTVGEAVGVDEVLADRSPEEKVAAVRDARDAAHCVMVGDGINDAPALAAADVGVVMGARGSTASSEAGDVVILTDRLERLAEALRISRRTRRIAFQSAATGMGLSAIAMVVAALGLLAPVGGALVQEAIDVAVILYALRALGGAQAEALAAEDMELGERLSSAHIELAGPVQQIRVAADTLDGLDPHSRLARARTVQSLLVEQILPHEQIDERSLYPTVARLIGGEDPTGPMSRAHVEIWHLTRLLGRLLEDAEPDGILDEDLVELRRLLYSLHAVLSLHFSQEDEAYHSLLERHRD